MWVTYRETQKCNVNESKLKKINLISKQTFLPGKRLQANCLNDLKTSHMSGGQLELDWVIEEKTF